MWQTLISGEMPSQEPDRMSFVITTFELEKGRDRDQ